MWAGCGALLGAGAGLGGPAGYDRVRSALSGRDRSREPGELVVMSGRDESRGLQRHQLIASWNRHPDNRNNLARLVEIGSVTDAHRSEMVAYAQSGQPGVDIYNLDAIWIAEFAEADYISPLPSDLDTSGFLRQPLSTCEYDDDLWALPFNTDAGLLFYPQDLQVGDIPLDWGAIEILARDHIAAQEPGRRPVAGYAGQLRDDYEGLTVNALERIWAAGGEVMAGDWWDPEILIEDSPGVEEALRHLSRVRDDSSRLIHQDSLTFDETDTTNAYLQGEVVFMRNWPVEYHSLVPDPDQDQRGDQPPQVQSEVERLPAGATVLGGQNLAVARNSARPHAARALIEFLTSEESQRELFYEGHLAATRTAVYEADPRAAAHPYARTLLDAIERGARQRPVTPYYPRFSEVFRSDIRHAIDNDGALPDGSADRLRNALQGRWR
jgi:multiple sugar transport system substrate-binding protein